MQGRLAVPALAWGRSFDLHTVTVWRSPAGQQRWRRPYEEVLHRASLYRGSDVVLPVHQHRSAMVVVDEGVTTCASPCDPDGRTWIVRTAHGLGSVGGSGVDFASNGDCQAGGFTRSRKMSGPLGNTSSPGSGGISYRDQPRRYCPERTESGSSSL